ncbi:hypothetical protein [Aestuariirhabdus sp. LZHN29]|uniref:hypothetical protein n=1 Tax=Aestuariirhabdus sp. LZHN29 TaxID=3417462 RepID=UPI003CF3D2F7
MARPDDATPTKEAVRGLWLASLLLALVTRSALAAPASCLLSAPTDTEVRHLQSAVDRAPGYCEQTRVQQVQQRNREVQKQLFGCLNSGRRVEVSTRQRLLEYQQLTQQLTARCGQ